MTILDQEVAQNMQIICAVVREALHSHWDSPSAFCDALEMYRKMAEEAWHATHDPLNLRGMAQDEHGDPQWVPGAADKLMCRFQHFAGQWFADQFAAGAF